MSSRNTSKQSFHPGGSSAFWKRPIRQPLVKLAVLAGLLMGAWLMYLGDVECLWLQLWGVPCPGCGMTRALRELLQGHLLASLRLHPMLPAVPILGLYFLYDGQLFRSRWLNLSVLGGILLGFLLHWVCRLVG